jgi:serine/threonine protein kinase
VIELLEGGSLRERLKKDVNCFLIENIKKLMKGILKGLEVIH